MALLMPPRSFAGDTSDGAWQWLLFARQQRMDAFTLTVVVHTKDGAKEAARALYEVQLDAQGLRTHIEELGVEVALSTFVELFKTTLTTRASVDITLEQRTHSVPQHAQLLLAYKFSESISRRGCFTLPLVAQAIPPQVVELLTALHATPSAPVLTDAQKLARDVATRPTISAAELAARVLGSSASATPAYPLSSSTSAPLTQATRSTMNGAASTSTSADASADASASATTSALKRRLVPSGAVRRKGPKGAKLAKN